MKPAPPVTRSFISTPSSLLGLDAPSDATGSIVNLVLSGAAARGRHEQLGLDPEAVLEALPNGRARPLDCAFLEQGDGTSAKAAARHARSVHARLGAGRFHR